MSNKTIHELSSLEEVAELDELPIYDVSATEAPTKKVTVGKIKEAVKGSYSTTEQLTGEKWIDGKPIYRIVLTTTSQINADDVSFGGLQTIISNLNIDTAIYAGGIDNTNRKSFRALLFSSVSGFLPLGSGLAPNSKIIFEYTKTNG